MSKLRAAMNYREPLPEGCPPEVAEEIVAPREVFRLVRCNPPSMKTNRHTTTLFYYDGPQVFEARDAVGGDYVAVMVEPLNGQDRYLVAMVDPERLRQFRAGLLDLRSLIAKRAAGDWFLAIAPAGLGVALPLNPGQGSLEASGFLPESGFFLQNHPAEELVLRESSSGPITEVEAKPPVTGSSTGSQSSRE